MKENKKGDAVDPELKEFMNEFYDEHGDLMKELKSIQETNYLLGNKANRENLMESIHQAEKEKALTPEEFEELTRETEK